MVLRELVEHRSALQEKKKREKARKKKDILKHFVNFLWVWFVSFCFGFFLLVFFFPCFAAQRKQLAWEKRKGGWE